MTPSAKGVKKTPRMPRNSELAPGLSRFSAGRIFHKRGLWKKLEKPHPAAEKKAAPEKFTVKKVGGAKNGGERKVLLTKTFKYKSQVRKPTKSAHRKPKGQPLRKSITPGTVLIVLAGRHRGKRVVFLKQLDSGLFAHQRSTSLQFDSIASYRSSLRHCHEDARQNQRNRFAEALERRVFQAYRRQEGQTKGRRRHFRREEAIHRFGSTQRRPEEGGCHVDQLHQIAFRFQVPSRLLVHQIRVGKRRFAAQTRLLNSRFV
ncbi:hypothetical protein M3Y94_00666200 [Aphelenchoides besseyi]|nr:hypothetical protein M3Y94_00666200 [Aphelenchoides besseyi]